MYLHEISKIVTHFCSCCMANKGTFGPICFQLRRSGAVPAKLRVISTPALTATPHRELWALSTSFGKSEPFTGSVPGKPKDSGHTWLGSVACSALEKWLGHCSDIHITGLWVNTNSISLRWVSLPTIPNPCWHIMDHFSYASTIASYNCASRECC